MGRYKASEVDNERYYQLPKALFTNPIYKDVPITAKAMYAVLKDRMTLSRANGWRDDNGDIYLVFKQGELAELLHLSERTTRKMLHVLEAAKLIDVKKQGWGKPDKIYIWHLFPNTIMGTRLDQSGNICLLETHSGNNCLSERQSFPPHAAKSSVHTYSETEKSETYKSDSASATRAREKNDFGFQESLREYEDCICPITSEFQKEMLVSLYERFGGKWLVEAVHEASMSGGRNMKYVDAILRRWGRDGFKSTKGAKNHGTSGRYSQANSGTFGTPARGKSDLSDFAEWERRVEQQTWGDMGNQVG